MMGDATDASARSQRDPRRQPHVQGRVGSRSLHGRRRSATIVGVPRCFMVASGRGCVVFPSDESLRNGVWRGCAHGVASRATERLQCGRRSPPYCVPQQGSAPSTR
jgi:hypothetical protein